ncbi:MAG: hypothetical protein K6F86_11450 [Lachnospiraceae bacterium]|nr:hypothetical protein [Lachnospiraceae bacterium]
MQTGLTIFFMIAAVVLLILYARLSIMLDKLEKRMAEIEESLKAPANKKRSIQTKKEDKR